MTGRFTLLLTLLVACAIVGAQAPEQFEVASVRQNVSGRAGGAIRVPPAGELSYTNVMLRLLIREAYQVDPYGESYRLDPGPYAGVTGSPAGGPQPDVPRFDVRAKPPDNTEPGARRAMMRALLEDRFKLRVHRETRQMPIYALTVAREGRLGPHIAPSQFDCEAFMAQRRFGGTAPEPVDANGEGWCLYFIDRSRPGVQVLRTAGPVSRLREEIQSAVDRPIVDATGLSGSFEWVLTYGWGPDAPSDVPDIFAALWEQLGLELEERRGPVEVLVIDSVELPMPN